MKTEHAANLHYYDALHTVVKCYLYCPDSSYPEINQLKSEEIYYLDDENGE
jgi:Pyruvate/2-oxoacid:ferredoxin oxidoreductase delta subunit